MPTIDDAEITERKHKRHAKESAEAVIGLSIADRLTRRAKAQIVTVALPADEDGVIQIKMQLPSWGLTCELAQMETLMGTPEGYLRIADVMNELCQTPGLDIEFWKSGVIGLADMRQLLEGLTSESVKLAQRVNEAQSFRED